MFLDKQTFKEQNSNYINKDLMLAIAFTYDYDFQQSNASKMDKKYWKEFLKKFQLTDSKKKPKIKDFYSLNPEEIINGSSSDDFILSSKHFSIISELQLSELSKNNQKDIKNLVFGIRVLDSDCTTISELKKYIPEERLETLDIEDGTADEILSKIDSVFNELKNCQELNELKQQHEQEEYEKLKREQEEYERKIQDYDEVVTLDTDVSNLTNEEVEENEQEVSSPDETELSEEEQLQKEREELENSSFEESLSDEDRQNIEYEDDDEAFETQNEEYYEDNFLEKNLIKLNSEVKAFFPEHSVEYEQFGYSDEKSEILNDYPSLQILLHEKDVENLNRTLELNEKLKKYKENAENNIVELLSPQVESNFDIIDKQTTVYTANDIANGAVKNDNKYQEIMDEREKTAFEKREKLFQKRDEIYNRNLNKYQKEKNEFLEEQLKKLEIEYDEQHKHEIQDNTDKEYDEFVERFKEEHIAIQQSLFDLANKEFIKLNDNLIPMILNQNKDKIDELKEEYNEKCYKAIEEYNATSKLSEEALNEELNNQIQTIVNNEQNLTNRIKEGIEHERHLFLEKEAKLRDENDKVFKEKTQLEAKIQNYNEKHELMTKQVDEYKIENEALRAENDNLKNVYNEQLKERNEEIIKNKKELERLNDLMSKREIQKEKDVENKHNLEERKINVAQSTEKLRYGIYGLGVVLLCGTFFGINYVNNNQKNDSNYQILQQIDSLKDNLDKEKDENDKLKKENDTLSRNIELDSQKQEIEKLKQELKESKEKNKDNDKSKNKKEENEKDNNK